MVERKDHKGIAVDCLHSELKEKEQTTHRNYDDVFTLVRSFGWYQKLLYIGMKLLGVAFGMQFSALVWTMGTPKFECTSANATCPPRKCCENCTSYEFTGGFTTTVTEWDLICDRGYVGATLQSLYFLGMLVGSLVTGPISDAWGRKICIFTCFAIMFISGVGSAYADCISLFGFLRFVVGLSLTGTMLSGYVYSMELVGPKKRTLAATLGGVFFLFDMQFSLLLAYLIRDWRLLMLVYSLLAAPSLLVWRLFPESPRWLTLNGRIDEAMVVLLKCGGKNGKELDPAVLRKLLEEICTSQKEAERERKYTHIDLIRTKKLRRYSLIMAFEWFTVAFTGFGIMLYISQLAGNIYVNYAIFDSFVIVNVALDLFFLRRFGRRVVLGVYCFIGGTALLVIQVIYDDYPILATGLVIFGMIIGPSWNGVYLVTVELFPTVLRNTGLGSGSLCARVGGILAPYFAMTAQLPGLDLTFPVTVFGVTILASGVLYFFLPETLFAKMHQTIEQAEGTPDDYGLVCCGKPLKRKPADLVEIDVPCDDMKMATFNRDRVAQINEKPEINGEAV